MIYTIVNQKKGIVVKMYLLKEGAKAFTYYSMQKNRLLLN